MTIHLPAELEDYINAKVQSGQFVDEDAAVAEAVRRFRQSELDQHHPVADAAVPSTGTGRKPLWERVDELREAVPAEELAKLPTDAAAELDHYLYGSPKRSTS